MASGFLPYTRLEHPDPITNTIIQDLYNKIDQTAVLVQQAQIPTVTTPTITATPGLGAPATVKQSAILSQITSVKASIEQVQTALLKAPAPAQPNLQTLLNSLINQLNNLNNQLTS